MADDEITVTVHEGESVVQALLAAKVSPPLWKRALSYLWAHKKQLAAAGAAGVALGKAGAGWLDILVAAAKAYVP